MSFNAWVQSLEAVYRETALTRMAGLPVMHPALQVQAVGFHARDGGTLGVLLTPWFMNLIWWEPRGTVLPVGQVRSRQVGEARFDFIGAHDPALGVFECCSLISPMFQFVDQEAAVATAEAVLAHLFPPTVAAVTPVQTPMRPDRRLFMLGRAGGQPAP